MKTFLIALLFPIIALAQSQEGADSISEIFAKEIAALENPNFPFSEKEMRDLFKQIDKLAPQMESVSNIEYNWNANSMKFVSQFNIYETRITLPKNASMFDAYRFSKNPEKLKAFQQTLVPLIVHEYAHALLNNHLLNHSPQIAKWYAELSKLNKEYEEKNVPEHLRAVPPHLRQTSMLFLGYHELFADTMSYLFTGDPNSIYKALRKGELRDSGPFPERRFDFPQKKEQLEKWREDMKKQSNGDQLFSPYDLFWPQRSVIRQLVKMERPNQEIINLLMNTILDAASEWPVENFRIDPKETNKRFAEILIERSTNSNSCKAIFQ